MQPHPLIHAELARQRQLDLRRGSRAAATNPDDLSPVVEAARSGDSNAWESLVTRFTPLLRHVVRDYRLGSADADDVVQTAWTSAFTNIGSLREADAISGWLCVIARREAIRTLRCREREVPVDEQSVADRADDSTPERALIEAENHQAVHAAIDRLPDRQRELLTTLLRGHDETYSDVARRLHLPVGSIGPTRERALARLRRDRHLVALR